MRSSCMTVAENQRFGRWVVIDPSFKKTYSSRAGNVRVVRAPLCRCDCGTVRAVYEPNLERGLTVSCGCYSRDRARERASGEHGERLRAWARSPENAARLRELAESPRNLEHLAHLNAELRADSEWWREIQRRAALSRTQHGLSGGKHPLYPMWSSMMQRCYNQRSESYPDYGARGIAVHELWHSAEVFIRWVEENLGPRPDGMSFDRIDNDGNYEPGNVRWADRSTQQRNKRTVRQLQARIAELERELRERGGDAR